MLPSLPSMFEVGCDLLQMAGLALASRGFEPLGERLLRIGIELVQGEADAKNDRLAHWLGRGGAFRN